MKRLVFLFSVIAALAITACCTREAEESFDANLVTATFNVSMPGDIATKAISDGTQATELLFRVFDINDQHLSSLDQTVAVSGKKATVTAKLVRGVTYKFVFWAQKPSRYTLADDSNGHLAVTLSANTLASMMNDDSFDAFYAMKTLAPQTADFAENITLYRPFAQINVGASADDIATAQANAIDLSSYLKTAFTIKGVKNSLDLLTGKASGSVDVTYTAKVAPTDNIITHDGATFRRIAMVYVLAPEDQSATVQTSLNVQTKQSGSIEVNFSREVPNVPVLRNHRTNIVGELFSLEGAFNVVIDENFDTPDKEVVIDVPAPTPVTYTVSIQENIANGTVSVANEGTEFEEGVKIQLGVSPAENYELAYLAYTPADGGEAVEIDLTTLSFQMPAFNVIVTARFAESTTPSTEGSGTLEDPFTVAGVRAYIDALDEYPSTEEVYVKGIVSRIQSSPSSTYSNASFYIKDNLTDTDEFEAFRINFFNNAPWTTSDPMVVPKDVVVVFGKVTLFTNNSGSTYETYQAKDVYNGYLISINGKNHTMTAPIITAVDPSGATASEIPAGSNDYLEVSLASSKSADIYYTLDGSTPSDASTKFTSAFRITEACTVKAIAYGSDALPSAVSSKTFTKASGGDTPGGEGSGTKDDPFTVAGVRAYIDALETYPSSEEVYVKGIVSSAPYPYIASSGSASFFIKDPNGTDEFEAYYVYYLNNQKWIEGYPNVAVDDEVVVCGKVTKFTGGDAPVYETYSKKNEYNGYLYSLNGATMPPAVATAPTISAADATGASTTVIPADSGASLTVTITGTNVRYTTDGSDPTENSTAYSAPFQVTSACTVKAIAIGTGGALNSSVVSLVITKANGGDTPSGAITYSFGEHADFASWGTSYENHTLSYTEADVVFEGANKQGAGNTITDIPVTKGKSVSLVMKNSAKISAVTFKCRQWGTKAQTITLHYSTDGGTTYTSTGVTSNNFEISSSSLPTGTNAAKITFSSSSNQVGIESVTFTIAD